MKPITDQLSSPGANYPAVVARVLRSPELIGDLCLALASPSPRVKYGSAKALSLVSERAPDLLYPRFDFFAGLLDGDNRILRWNAMRIVGNLASADSQEKVEALLDRYLAPISGPELIDAGNTIGGAAAIALAKPHLADRIAAAILQVSRATYATPECRNVAAGHAIQALARFFPHVQDKKPVLAFVRAQLKNSRPATRKKAEKFLKKFA